MNTIKKRFSALIYFEQVYVSGRWKTCLFCDCAILRRNFYFIYLVANTRTVLHLFQQIKEKRNRNVKEVIRQEVEITVAQFIVQKIDVRKYKFEIFKLVINFPIFLPKPLCHTFIIQTSFVDINRLSTFMNENKLEMNRTICSFCLTSLVLHKQSFKCKCNETDHK